MGTIVNRVLGDRKKKQSSDIVKKVFDTSIPVKKSDLQKAYSEIPTKPQPSKITKPTSKPSTKPRSTKPAPIARDFTPKTQPTSTSPMAQSFQPKPLPKILSGRKSSTGLDFGWSPGAKQTAQDVSDKFGKSFSKEGTIPSFAEGAIRSAIFANQWDKRLGKEDTTLTEGDTARTVGEFAGMVAPIAGAYATGGRLATNLGSKILPNAGRTAQSLIRGGGAGATFGAAESLAGGDSPSEAARNIAFETALFAGGDAAITAAAPYVGKGLSAFMNNKVKPIYDKIKYNVGEKHAEQFKKHAENVFEDARKGKPTTKPLTMKVPKGTQKPATARQKGAVQEGDKVYWKGKPHTVTEASDPSLLKIRNNQGKEFSIGKGKVSKTTTRDTGTVAFPDDVNVSLPKSKSRGGIAEKGITDINRELSEKLGVPIRKGRFNQKASGIFKVKPEVIRIKNPQDIATTAHEVGHFLDKKLKLSQVNTPRINKELVELGERTSKPSYSQGRKQQEGIAEFFRLYLTDPEEAARNAPLYFTKLEDRLARVPDAKNTLLQARKDIEAYRTQSGYGKAASKISFGAPAKRDFEALADKAIRDIVDGDIALKRTIDEAERKLGQKLPTEANPLNRAARNRGDAGAAQAYLKWGVMFDENTGKAKEVSKGLEEILKPVKNRMHEISTFLVVRRARELLKQGREKLFTKQDIDDYFKELTKEDQKLFSNVADEIYKYQDNLLKKVRDEGLISDDAYRLMKEMNEYYIPFYRVAEEGKSLGNVVKKATGDVSSPVKRLRGGLDKVQDPMESIVRNTFAFISAANRNRVMRNIADLSDIDGMGKLVEKVPTPMKSQKISVKEIDDQLKRLGINATKGIDDILTIFRSSGLMGKEARDNVAVAYRNGKPEYYQLDPDIYEVVTRLDQATSNFFVKMAAPFASWLRTGAILDPSFSIANPIRDIPHALLVSGLFKPGHFVKGVFETFKKGDLYKEYLASGAGQANLVSLDRNYLQQNLRGILRRERIRIPSPMELLRGLSEGSEMATRLGEFSASKEAGYSVQEAAVRARDLIDYGRYGKYIKETNRIIAFFNAPIQSLNAMYNAAKRDKAAFFGRGIAYISTPSFALYFVNRNNPDYWELPQWRRDLCWNIPYNNGRDFFSFPKPFEAGVIFGTTVERALEFIDQPEAKDPNSKRVEALDNIGKRMWENGVPSFVPNVLIPMAEVAANYSKFFDSPIVPLGQQGLIPKEQWGPGTSETAKLLGQGISELPGMEENKLSSPRNIDHLIRGYFAGLGTKTTQGLDQIIKAVDGKDRPPEPAEKLQHKIPVVDRFFTKGLKGSQSISDFYEDLQSLESKYQTTREREEPMITEKEYVKLKAFRKIASRLSDLNKARDKVYKSEDMSPQEKRKELDKLNLLRVRWARVALGRPVENMEKP